MKLRSPGGQSRLVKVIAFVAIFAFLLGGGAGYLIFKGESAPEKFPELVTHKDLLNRPMASFQASLNIALPADALALPASTCPALSSHWVTEENQKPGLPNMTIKLWKHVDLSGTSGSALWLDQTSVACGDKVNLHAALYQPFSSSSQPKARTFAAYRIGYYAGAGAREIWKSDTFKLKPGKSTTSKDATRFTQAKWPATTTFTVGKEWTPGFYLIVSLAPNGTIENAAPLVVRSPIGSSKLIMMHSFLTWNAYNSFGGRSTYKGPGENIAARKAQRSRVASFDRPILGSGAYAIQRDSIPFVQFSEKEGINVDQVSDLDIDQWPSLASHYNGLLLIGHCEYFTNRMFNTFIALRNSGVNLAIFGGNTGIWQVRLQESAAGPRRIMAIYRVANQDPVSDLKQVSIQFADERLNTPASLITGEQTAGVHVFGKLDPVEIPHWLTLPTDPVIDEIGNDTEGDGVRNNVATPPNIHIIFAGKLKQRDPGVPPPEGSKRIVQTIWFTTPSGSAIFNAGMTTWNCNLMASCIDLPYSPKAQEVVAATTRQVLQLWQNKKLGVTLK